jgi:peptidyl-Lys metalloendopeptidase
MNAGLVTFALGCAVTVSPFAEESPATAPRCTLEVPARVAAGQPVMLRFTLTNPSKAGAVQVLRWNTPLEGGWFAPFVAVTRDGQALPFRGPSLKRGEPLAEDYLRLDAGASATAELDMAPAFDLSRPGRYRITPHIRLIDVFRAAAAQPPRDRAQHAGAELACKAVEVMIAAR